MKVWCLRWCLVTKRPARLSTNLAFGTRRFWILLSSSSKIARSSVLSVQCWRRRLMGRFSLPRSLLLALSFWICWRTVCSHSRGCDINTTDSLATAAGSAVVAWWPVTRTMDWTVRIRSPRSLWTYSIRLLVGVCQGTSLLSTTVRNACWTECTSEPVVSSKIDMIRQEFEYLMYFLSTWVEMQMRDTR
jgi:hypothetical protein